MEKLRPKTKAKGVLLDITGVLIESDGILGTVIEKSVDAVQKLKLANIPFRLITNESSITTKDLLQMLLYHNFPVTLDDVFSPLPATVSFIKEQNLRPHLLIGKKTVEEFHEFEKTKPTCVVIGDAHTDLNYENLNSAFRALVEMEKPILISLGKGKYYRGNGELQLDVGSFAAALEYACDIEAVVIGKPSPDYFNAVLKDMDLPPEEVIMVGDDINSDVGGAQKCGMKGILVKTGKFTPANLSHPTVKPDFIADDLYHAVDYILS